MAIDHVEILHYGTAAAADVDGVRHVVRLIDLPHALGRIRVDSPRIVSIATTGAARVTLGLSDNSQETVSFDAPTAEPDLVIEDIGLAITCMGEADDVLGYVTDAAIICSGGRIRWIGPDSQVNSAGFDLTGARRIDAGGRMVSPGLIDCHSHPMFAGNRGGEFARRAAGHSYQEIAAAGGGITATLHPTRMASVEDHIALTAARMDRAFAAGTTTTEAKSGYDLTCDGELRLLSIAKAVDAVHPVDLVPTLLGAHLIPPEYKADRAQYVDLVANQMVPAAAERRLADAVDVYCDDGAFTLAETRTILEAAQRADLKLRAHVGQFADLGAAELVAELGGLSADHMENVSDAGIAAMASNDVVAVMLPGACVQLRMTPPPVDRLRAAGVRMAVASDLNPGTSFCETLPIQMWLASTHYGMTVEEAWLGVTRYAAQAMGRHDIGVLMVGAAADLVVWDAEHPGDVPYRYGANLAHRVIKRGRIYPG